MPFQAVVATDDVETVNGLSELLEKRLGARRSFDPRHHKSACGRSA